MRFLRRIFTIKEVPSVSWSSDFPLNSKPRSYTVIMLITGLFFFGVGEAIIIGSGSGVSPWTVLAQGISTKTDLSVGTTTFLISIAILIFWIPLKQVPGIGTILNAIIVASYGTFSTGINIKRLHNVIFASPSKSRVRNLQSIGRVLRKGENKSQATLYDIADDISTDRGNNYTLNHLMERVKVYNEEKFQYEIIDVKLKAYD